MSIDHFVRVEFNGYHAATFVNFICEAGPDGDCHMVCAQECEECDHPRTQRVAYCNPGEFIDNGGDGAISQAEKQDDLLLPVSVAWNGDTYAWTVDQNAMIRPVAEAIVEAAKDHAIEGKVRLTELIHIANETVSNAQPLNIEAIKAEGLRDAASIWRETARTARTGNGVAEATERADWLDERANLIDPRRLEGAHP